MNHTAKVLDERIDEARARLAEAAKRAAEPGASVTAQLAVEQELDDVVHWVDARSKALALTTYRPDGAASFVADVIDSTKHADRSAQRRLRLDSEVRSTMSNFGGQVVPQFLVDQARLSGSGRPLCDLLAQPLLADGATMNLVRVTTGTTAEAQSSENTAATPDTGAVGTIALPVVSVLSEATVAWQVIDRSVGASFDQVVAGDMLRALDAEQERLVLNGSGSSGQPTGLLNQSGIGSVTLTSTSATDLLDAVSQAAQQSHAATGDAPDTVIISPRRWQRTLAKAGNYPTAVGAAIAPTGPIRGQLVGLDVVVSPQVPTTLGTSTNEDVIVVCRRADVVMAESNAELLVQRDKSTASQLQADLVGARQFVIGAIRPAGVVKVVGAGLAAPY